MPVRKQLPTFAGNNRIHQVEKTVYRKKPHEQEMERHSFSQTLWYVQQIIIPIGKEVKKSVTEKRDAVCIISPVDQHSAPDHNGQDWKIYPVRPSHQKRMFFLND